MGECFTEGAANNIHRLRQTGPGILVPDAAGTLPFTVILTGNEKRGHYALDNICHTVGAMGTRTCKFLYPWWIYSYPPRSCSYYFVG